MFYTIGQRKGLGIAFGQPMYVTEIDPVTNTVVLGEIDDLLRNGMIVRGLNKMKYDNIPSGMELTTKVRYKDSGAMSTIIDLGDSAEVHFQANVKGIAPGQSAVIYEGDDLVAGGIIYSSL